MILRIIEMASASIISIIGVALFAKPMKRAFETLTTTNEFPYNAIESIGHMMMIHIWVLFFSIILGSPIILFAPSDQTQIIMFLFFVMTITSVFRLINITGIGNNFHEEKHESNRDLVTWCLVAFGASFFLTLTVPNFLDNAFSHFVAPALQQMQTISVTIVFGSFFVALLTEIIGIVYKKLARQRVVGS